MFRNLLLLILLCVFTGCGYNEFGELSAPARDDLPMNIELKELRAHYKGEPVTINAPLVIGGYVTANDRSDNFYRTIIIQDVDDVSQPTYGAVELRIGLYSLYHLFPEGRYVAVRAEGLTLSDYNGILQLGLEPAESGSTLPGYFGYRAVMDQYVVPGTSSCVVEPIVFEHVGNFSETMCGCLVRITSVRLAADTSVTWGIESGWNNKPQTAYRIFFDRSGTSFAVVTSGYADFAGETVPREEVSITGILSYGRTDTGKEMYMIKMRDIRDVIR